LALYTFGDIRYIDDFGMEHFRRFCFNNKQIAPTTTPITGIVKCDRYNDADKY
jgi:hypothetical protein